MFTCLIQNKVLYFKYVLFYYSGSLRERHIQNGDAVYAIFTPKENLRRTPQMPKQKLCETNGTEVIRCHIMLRVQLNHCPCSCKCACHNFVSPFHSMVFASRVTFKNNGFPKRTIKNIKTVLKNILLLRPCCGQSLYLILAAVLVSIHIVYARLRVRVATFENNLPILKQRQSNLFLNWSIASITKTVLLCSPRDFISFH